MTFAQPIWLFLGITTCAALLWRYRQFDRKQSRDLVRVASDTFTGRACTATELQSWIKVVNTELNKLEDK